MATIPVFSPQIPFLGLIPGGFRPSLMIRIKGKVTSKRGRFSIDFINSPALNVEQDIMFHMSIRMDEKCIVRNSYERKQWKGEERYGAFRIGHKDPFEIIILAEFEFYKIAVNGVHLGVFRHRLPLQLVQYIHVKGDVAIEHILYEQDVKSAQEQARLGHIIQSVTAAHPSAHTHHMISTSTVAAPAFPPQPVIGATTSTMPAHNPPYPVGMPQPYDAQVHTAPSAPPIHSTYEPPPAYEAQNQTWVFRKM